jgi:diguanylate cyclase (GGDEF)-like protein/PAS domain S-box-containing protein
MGPSNRPGGPGTVLSAQALEAVVAAAPLPVISVDLEGCVTSWNPAAMRLFGWHEDEVLGTPLPVIPPDRREEAEGIRTQTEAGESYQDVEVVRQSRDGTPIHLSLSTAPLTDEHGRIVGTMLIYADLVARKAAEEVLREQAAALRERAELLELTQEALRRQQERQQAIIATQREIAQVELDLDAIMQAVVRRVMDLTGAEVAGVALVDGAELVYRAFSDPVGVGIRVGLDTSLVGLAVRTGELQMTRNAGEDPRADAAAVTMVGIESALTVPLRHGGAVIGAFAVSSPRPDAFGSEEIETLELIAGQLSAAMSHAAQWEAEQALARERAAALERLQQSEEQFRTLIDRAPVGICVVTVEGIFEQINDAYAAMLGYRAHELLGRNVSIILPAEQLAAATESRRQAIVAGTTSLVEADVIHKDGRRMTLLATSVPLTVLGGEQRRVSFAVDITERKQAERALEHRALHDALTGLGNRVALQDRLDAALQRARRDGEMVAVLFVDLDGFKTVNDRFGHDAGDALLVSVARSLAGLVRSSDTVARLAGDEFVLVLPNIVSMQNAVTVAEKVLSACQSLSAVDSAWTISASVGISLFPFDARTADELLHRADAAMYRAKSRGKNTYALYGEEHRPER